MIQFRQVGETMKYPAVTLAYFLQRDNRFVAQCQLIETGEIVTVHVKNTGRGKEVFVPKALVALSYVPKSHRKTAYDLIAVQKEGQWFNIDSQAPNQLVETGLQTGQIKLKGVNGQLTNLRREVVFQQSRFDFYFETDLGEKGFIEVKGMTLENQEIGAFPDAPTIRGLKHVKELIHAQQLGYQCSILFIAQFEKIQIATIHTKMQPELTQAFQQGIEQGLSVQTYACQVTEEQIILDKEIPFALHFPFVDPN